MHSFKLFISLQNNTNIHDFTFMSLPSLNLLLVAYMSCIYVIQLCPFPFPSVSLLNLCVILWL